MGRKKQIMSRFPWLVIVIIFAAATSQAIVLYQGVQIHNLNARLSAAESVFIRQHGEIQKAVQESVEAKYKAYNNGVHACQSMCYGRMKSYEMNEKEVSCVCFSGFTNED
jgi:hypothetical protein